MGGGDLLGLAGAWIQAFPCLEGRCRGSRGLGAGCQPWVPAPLWCRLRLPGAEGPVKAAGSEAGVHGGADCGWARTGTALT